MAELDSDDLSKYLEDSEIWGVRKNFLSTKIGFKNDEEALNFLDEILDDLKQTEADIQVSIRGNDLLFDVEIGSNGLEIGEKIERKLKKF